MSSVQVTIVQLPTAQPLSGTESVPIVQNGQTVQTTVAAIAASPSQFQTFLTVNQEPTLPNSQYLSTGTGLGLVDGGAQSYLRITLNGAAGSLESALNGIVVKTGASTVINRSVAVSGSGLAISDGDGVAGNPTISLSGIAASLAGLTGPGLVASTGATVTPRILTGTIDQITVTNGTGAAGNPTVAISSDPVLPGTGAVTVPVGTTAQQPGGSPGQIRYNTDTNTFWGYSNGSWNQFTTSGAITLINTGTGLTGGPITTTGTISIANTGVAAGTYGSATKIPQIVVNAQGQLTSVTEFSVIGGVSSVSGTANEITASPTTGNVVVSLPTALTFTGKTVTGGTFNMTAATVGADTVTTNSATQVLTNKTINGPDNNLTNIANASLSNSSVTYNGITVALGGSGTITAATTAALTSGTGLQFNTGTTFDGSVAKTISIDSTVATLSGIQTLTNKTISGANNTLSDIGNSSLTNSSLSYNGVTVSLGGSGTITAVNPNALTIGTGLTGTSYDGASAVTITIDSTVATLTGNQTLTNKSMSGATNTFTNIPNSALSNSTISGVALGGTLFALTIGTGLTGGSYDGSGIVTVAIDSTVATLTGIQTLTNKSISGSTNTLTNIPNSALTNSSVTIGTTNVALGGTASTLAGLTSVTVTQNPVNNLELATKQYVDSIAVQGTYYHAPVKYETASPLTATYNQPGGPGVGVGATLTNSGTLGAFTPDGVVASVNDRILVYRQANQYENGVYTVTTVGNGSTPWVLTRSTDTDTYGLINPNTLGQGDAFFVQAGNTGSGETYICNTVGTITFGTTNITFVQISDVQIYTAGTGLTLSGTQFSITNTGVTAATYGSASQSLTLAVNAQGQITSASAQSIAIDGNQITSGTVGSAYISGSYTNITGVGTLTAGTWNATKIDPAYGGTGLSAYTTGDLLYASGTTTISKLGIGTSGQYLSSTGSAPQWSSPAALTKTDDTNVTLTLGGSASTALLNAASITVGWTGQLATTRGGTGLSSYTAGDLVYYATGTALSKLAIGTSTQILTSSGTAPQWTSGSTITVGTATNLAGGSAGALPYQTGAGATTFLSLGTTNYVLTAGATAPQYVAQSTLSVGSATNATNVATTATATNATFYPTFVSATTGNNGIGVDADLTYNPSTNTLTAGTVTATTGIFGGTF